MGRFNRWYTQYRIDYKRTWPCDIWIVKSKLHATLYDPCIRVSLSKSSCEETPEESLRVNRQSLCIHLPNIAGLQRSTDSAGSVKALGYHSCQNASITIDADASHMHTCLDVTQSQLKFRAHGRYARLTAFPFPKQGRDRYPSQSGLGTVHVPLTACINTIRWNLYPRSQPSPRVCKLMSAVSPERKALYRWDCIS